MERLPAACPRSALPSDFVEQIGHLARMRDVWQVRSRELAGTPSRKHSKNQQGYLSDSHLAETVGTTHLPCRVRSGKHLLVLSSMLWRFQRIQNISGLSKDEHQPWVIQCLMMLTG